MIRKRDIWAKEHFSDDFSRLPFGFTYGGRKVCEFIQNWIFTTKTSFPEPDRIKSEFSWSDPDSGLNVICIVTEYIKYPAIEWTVYLKNCGTLETPVIENIQGLDVSFEKNDKNDKNEKSPFVIKTIRGDDCSASSFKPITVNLSEIGNYKSEPSGGRPTNTTAFPYFNISWGGEGVLAVIGWPGQWAAEFSCENDTIKILGGQASTHMKLLPGEEIRTPLSVLMFYEGGDFKAQNMWRRFMTECNIPRPNGKLFGPMSSICMGLQQSEKTERDAMGTYADHNFKHDYWWMDAGWYPCEGNWGKTGTWEADKTRFPNGIKAVADMAHAKGMGLVLWFEPERVFKDSELYREHPEWLIMKNSSDENHLLNLGNPEAQKWLTAHINRFIAENGIDVYRQDFNIDPLGFWQFADAPGRTGMTENLYVQGLLKFWDSIHENHPGIIIDTCASGGRRIDLETLRRAFPLLRSDFQEPAVPPQTDMFSGNQGHTYGLAMWVPYYGTGCFFEDRYSFLSHLCPAMGIGYNYSDEIKRSSVDWEKLHDTLRIWRAVADNFFGDFYQLTEYSLSGDVWMAWQFDTPETGEGFIQAFRRENAPEETMNFKLYGLEQTAEYEVADLQKANKEIFSGRSLMDEGLTVSLDGRRQTAVLLYKKTR
ncbi:MAG: alpha-galactosidase [Oscillospiraceae bacterium]|nr:alpha-galactosidase [Oscillospiraceae bacterium]